MYQLDCVFWVYFTMATRKRKSRKQEETEEEDDCFQMQQKIVNLLRDKVHRLEDELNFLRSHQTLLYRAWSMPVYPPEYEPGFWTPPDVLPEQLSPQVEQADICNQAGQSERVPKLARKAKRRKTEVNMLAAPIPPPKRKPVSFQQIEACDSDTSIGPEGPSSESDHEQRSPVVETVTTESVARSESSSSDDSSSDEEGEKIKSSGSQRDDESSSDSDGDKTTVPPAIGETKMQPNFPRANWADEPRKRRAGRASSSSGSDSDASDDSVSTVEVADEEVISQTKAHKVEFKGMSVKECAIENSLVSEEKKNGDSETTPRSADKLKEARQKKKKKKGNSRALAAEPSDTGNVATREVDKLFPDATPEDIFDWNVLGLPGLWTPPKASSVTHWHGSSDNSAQWPKQLKSLPCRFSSSDEYMTRNQWLIFEECKALLDSSWEIMQKRDGFVIDSRIGPDGIEDNLQTRMFQLRSMHRCADDSFNYYEVESLDGRRFQLDMSEVLLLSSPKFPDIKVLAIVNSQGDKSVLLKTRVDLRSYCSQYKLARMSNMVTLKRQFVALVSVPKIWHSLRLSLLDPLLNTGCTVSPPGDDCLDENAQLPANASNTLLTWKEYGIFNNRQLLTIAALLQMKQGFLLVQGPPGTGKPSVLVLHINFDWGRDTFLRTCQQTSTIVGMVSALCIEEPGAKILVCAASNAAVDEIVSRLMHTMLDIDGKLYAPPSGTLIRVGVQKSVQVACHPVTMDTLVAKCSKASRSTARSELLSGASIVCSTLSGSGHPVFNEGNQKFDVLIIDEAAQALECETLIALQRAKGRCVIIGDPCQLPATVIQRPGTAYGRSLFERMQQGGMQTFLMTTQYRMHPQISKYPSMRFYRGCLRDSKSTQCTQPIFREDACDGGISCDGYRFRLGPYCFLDVSWGEEEIEAAGHSLSNVEEAAVVATVVNGVVKSLKKGRKADIGVITPYLAQRSTILTSLLRYKIDESVCEVNTVDGFQGREKDVIILSCVRAVTEKGLGFVSDEKRMNVALTRAKHALIIIGHGKTLKSQSASWKALLEDAASRGCYQVLRGGGANKISGKSSLAEKTAPVVSEKAAKFHSAQTSPVKKTQSLASKSTVLPAVVKVEPTTCDIAHHIPGCGHNNHDAGQQPDPKDTVKTMRGAVRMKGPAQHRGGGGGQSMNHGGNWHNSSRIGNQVPPFIGPHVNRGRL